jgi:peptidoglycan hydrolase CwlO-like protein
MLVKKFALVVASAMLATTVAFATNARPAYAADKVDCDAVMNELNSGKHQKDVAKDLNTTLYQVRKCNRKAKAAAKAATKSLQKTNSGREVPAAPAMAAPAPAAAASATTK